MLPVPRSKVFSRTAACTSCTRTASGLRVLGVFRGSVLRILLDSQYFGVRYSAHSLCTSSTSGFCTAGAASTRKYPQKYFVRSTKIISMCPVYSGVWIIPRPSVHRVDNFLPIICRIYSQMVPRVGVGANYFRWEQLEYLVLAVFQDYMLLVSLAVVRGSVLRILPYSKYCGVRYC